MPRPHVFPREFFSALERAARGDTAVLPVNQREFYRFLAALEEHPEDYPRHTLMRGLIATRRTPQGLRIYRRKTHALSDSD